MLGIMCGAIGFTGSVCAEDIVKFHDSCVIKTSIWPSGPYQHTAFAEVDSKRSLPRINEFALRIFGDVPTNHDDEVFVILTIYKITLYSHWLLSAAHHNGLNQRQL